jgi:hypothetical protein
MNNSVALNLRYAARWFMLRTQPLLNHQQAPGLALALSA